MKFRKNIKAVKKAIALLLGIALITSYNLKAQENLGLFYFNSIPQSARLNPAATFDYNGYFGGIVIPLSGQIPPPLNIGFTNNSFSYSDIFYKPGGVYGDSLVWVFHDSIRARTFADGLKPVVRFDFNTYIDLFHMGFRNDNLFWHFSIVEKVEAGVGFPRDLLRLPLYGNANFPDPYINLSGFGARAIHYREYGFGAAIEINQDLIIGTKAKLLFGKANLDMRKTDLKWFTDPNTSNFRISGDFDINLSQPIIDIKDIRWDSQGDSLVFEKETKDFKPVDYALNGKNLGMALDLGVSYSPVDKLKLHASITDLGFISWKKDVTNIKAKGEFNFEGLNLNDLLDDSVNIGNLMADSLFRLFNFEVKHQSYRTAVPFNLYLGTNYFLTDNINLGVFYRGRKWIDEMISSVTFSLNYNRRGSGAVVTYTLMPDNFNNLGLGFTLKFGGWQTFIITDNLLDAIYPQNAREISIRLGTNWVLGRQKKHASLIQ